MALFGKHTLPAWLWALALLVVCLLPGSSLPQEPVVNADKIFHALCFGFLAYLWVRGWKRQETSDLIRRQAWPLALVATIAFGGLIEIFQETFAQNRSADWLDFLFDALGALLGVSLYSLVTWYGKEP